MSGGATEPLIPESISHVRSGALGSVDAAVLLLPPVDRIVELLNGTKTKAWVNWGGIIDRVELRGKFCNALSQVSKVYLDEQKRKTWPSWWRMLVLHWCRKSSLIETIQAVDMWIARALAERNNLRTCLRSIARTSEINQFKERSTFNVTTSNLGDVLVVMMCLASLSYCPLEHRRSCGTDFALDEHRVDPGVFHNWEKHNLTVDLLVSEARGGWLLRQKWSDLMLSLLFDEYVFFLTELKGVLASQLSTANTLELKVLGFASTVFLTFVNVVRTKVAEEL